MEIRDALNAAFDENEQVEAPIVEVAETQTDNAQIVESPNRDEQGKFKATEPTPPLPERKAPSSWKPDAQSAWMKADKGQALTPEEVRILALEAERREGDFHKGVEEFKTHAQKARAYEQVIAPYEQTIKALGVDAPTAIGALLKADHTLRHGDQATKTAYFAQLAKSYGIDLGQAQEIPETDPQIKYLMDELNSLRQSQQQWHNQAQQQETTQANEELAAFQNAGNAHFDAVRGDMADLLTSGKASTLKEAYDMAVWMKPDIRQTLIEKQVADARQKALEQAQHLKAKSAVVGVKGSSPASGGVAAPKGSLREALEASFATD
jgi:hypothetical protein